MNHGPRTRLRVLQVSPSKGQRCGIANFADTLATRLEAVGVEVQTVAGPVRRASADLILLQHHSDLLSEKDVRAWCETGRCPVVLFAHERCIEAVTREVDGILAMCPDIVKSFRPAHFFPHPAWTPPFLEERVALRREFGLPQDAFIVGTNGFLKFEREFEQVAAALLPIASREGWLIDINVSPWRLPSPGIMRTLESLRRRYPAHLRVQYGYIESRTLNRRLQAADVLWCWTAAASSAYASGAISDQYASGTRVIAADKLQHEHVLALSNVVRAPDTLREFIDRLIAELESRRNDRHDPDPVSWGRVIRGIAKFLERVGREPKRERLQ